MNSLTSFLFGLILFCYNLPKSEQVGCLVDQVVGKWQLHEGGRGHNQHLSCQSFNPQEGTHVLQVELKKPNVVIDAQLNHKGTWTMVYDWAIEINIDYRNYLAFFYWDDEKLAQCNKTMAGWSHDTYARDWACFYATKISSEDGVAIAITSDVENRGPIGTMPPIPPKQYSTEQMFIHDMDVIDEINTIQDSWKATPYKFWETHKFPQMHAGISVRVKPQPAEVTPKLRRLADKLPTSWDWRSVNGQNYVSPVRNQGGCGSCYAFASLAMMEARVRVGTNNQNQPVFSPMDIVECSNYTLGCGGGFPIMVGGNYATEFGLVLESCNPYEEAPQNYCTTNTSCQRYYSTEYHYVGGYFGGCNEAAMRLALVQNGPVSTVIDFEECHLLMHYKSGVFAKTSLNRMPRYPKLEPVDHAVLIVGYGTDPKKGDYWIVKNSWGTDWGEKGYFKVKRGTDECSIESMAYEATPIPTY